MSEVRLQLLLKPLSRNERGIKDASNAGAQVGLSITGSGAASLSARCSRETFVRVFGFEPAQGPTDSDVPVPDALIDYISNITIAPEHIQMTDQ